MAGLLDSLMGSSIDDPKTLGLLQLAASLSSGPKFMPALSEGLLGRSQIMSSAERQKAQQQMQQMQLQQMQRQMAQQQAQDQFRASIPSPQMQASQAALAGGGGPTMANAQNMRQVDPMAQMMHGAMQAGVVDPMQYLASLQPKPRKLTTVAPGASVIDENDPSKPLFTAPKEVSKPAALQEYEFAKSQGYPGTFQQYVLEQKRAGAPSVSVSMDKGFGTTFADNAAKDLGASRDKARAAANTINTLNNIDRIVSSGNVATGPAQPFQVLGMQIADAIGVGGKNNAEKLANTRQVMQGAATLALDGAAKMAGQGQITEGERALISAAAGGNIDRMTTPEIKALTGALRKVNQASLSSHQNLLKNVGPQFKAFTPFYEVQTPASADGWNIQPVGGQ